MIAIFQQIKARHENFVVQIASLQTENSNLKRETMLQSTNDPALKECKADKEYFRTENTQLKAVETVKIEAIKKHCHQQITWIKLRSEKLATEWNKILQKVQSCLKISE